MRVYRGRARGHRIDCPGNTERPSLRSGSNPGRFRKPVRASGAALPRSAHVWIGGCPYDGVLALEMADGRTLTLHKATDSCGCIVFGSMGGYELSDEDNARFWALFDQVASALEIQ